jgi:hypothetical protein
MKSLRTMVLVLAVTAISFSATRAFSQQEVDPDHFDQPAAAAKAAAPVRNGSARHQTHGSTSLASKHSKQHHSRASA